MSTVRINATATFVSGFVLQNSSEAFPASPRIGQFFVKDFQLYAYLRIGELETWYPLAARTRSYVHSQAQASTVWRVDHNLGTTDVWFTAYSADGIELVNKQTIDANSFTLTFDQPLSGTVVVVAPDSLSVPTVTAGQISVGSVHISSSGVTIGGFSVLTSQSLETQINAAIASLVTQDQLLAERALRVAADSANASLIAAEAARAQAAENLINSSLATKVTAAQAAAAAPVQSVFGRTGDVVLGSADVTGALGYTPVNPNALTGTLTPEITGTVDLGSPTKKFRSIYTQELYLDANTLYVDGVPVIGSSANTIQITADPNQSMRVATTGAGSLTLDSQHQVNVQTNGLNADVLIQSVGQGSLTRVSSGTEVVLTAPTVRVAGNLTVAGTTTQVDTTNLAISDNILTVNRGQIGTGVSLRYAGLDVERGDAPRQRLVWDETTGRWVAGTFGAEQVLVIASELASEATQRAAGDTANAQAIAAEISRAQARENEIAAEVSLLRQNYVTPELDSILEVAAAASQLTTRLDLLDTPTGVTAGIYGSGTQIPVLEIDAKGRVIAASFAEITIDGGTF